MFGFPLIRQIIFPLQELTLEKMIEDYFRESTPDLASAKLLDNHTYSINGIQYVQKVYRLKDNSIFTHTEQDIESSRAYYSLKLEEAIKKQYFEEAAYYRDLLKTLR